MKIDVPRGWSPFSDKPKLPVECQVDADSFQLGQNDGWYEIAHVLAKLEREKAEVACDLEKPSILIPVYYQGIGDWLRSVISIRNLKSVSNQRVVLVCLDTPVARDMVKTQLRGVVSEIIWVPKTKPFYHDEAECSLDWYFCQSHLAWDIIFKHLADQNTDSIVLRNPNHKLPPYDEFMYDFRLGMLNSARQNYSVSEESRVFAEEWFNAHQIDPCKTFGIGFRTDRNLSSSHRMSNQNHINRVIAYLALNHPECSLLFFGDKPEFDVNTRGLNFEDFTECWLQGVTLNQQAAVLSQTMAVSGINSGSIDLPVMTGVPALRLRTHRPPSPYFNDQISSALTVNVMKYGDEEEQLHSLDNAIELFFSELSQAGNGQQRIFYVGSKTALCRDVSSSADEDGLNIESVLSRADPKLEVIDADAISTEELEMTIWQFYKKGVFPIITTSQTQHDLARIQESIFSNGYGWKYLNTICTGIVCSPDEVVQVTQNLLDSKECLRKAIYAGYLKAFLRAECKSFSELVVTN